MARRRRASTIDIVFETHSTTTDNERWVASGWLDGQLSALGQRQANMEFLRDRIIEAGKCGGLDLGLNLKRGGPDISIDFLAWRRSDGAMGHSAADHP